MLRASTAVVLVEAWGDESSVGVVSRQYVRRGIGNRIENSFCKFCSKGKEINGVVARGGCEGPEGAFDFDFFMAGSITLCLYVGGHDLLERGK